MLLLIRLDSCFQKFYLYLNFTIVTEEISRSFFILDQYWLKYYFHAKLRFIQMSFGKAKVAGKMEA